MVCEVVNSNYVLLSKFIGSGQESALKTGSDDILETSQKTIVF